MPRTHHSNDFDAEVDVLVVGAGGCGLVAAISAAERGAKVAIVEKLDRPGGNSALSTGSVPGGGSRFQREAGIDDSADVMCADLLRQSGPHEAEHLVRLLCDESAGLVEWLVDQAEVRLQIITDYKHVGHSVPRLHAPASRRGTDLVGDLVRTVREREIPLAFGNPVTDLFVDEQGAVCGALVSGDRVAETRIGAKKVVLAANGFAGNRAMLREFCPDIAEAEYFGAHGSTGEAIQWGRALGAGLANMGAYQGYAAVAYPHGSIMSWTVIEKGGFIVNAAGRRFGDESKGYSGFAADVLAQGVRVQAIFDTRIRDYAASNEEEFRELCDTGGVRTGNTPQELARLIGAPEAEFARTVAQAEQFAAGGGSDPHGRTDFGFGPLVSPYATCQVTPGLFHTQGGLRVDARSRAVRAAGGVIPNLFAGGGVAAGISGRSGGSGYSSGNGLLTALGLGRIAGATAAEEVLITVEKQPAR